MTTGIAAKPPSDSHRAGWPRSGLHWQLLSLALTLFIVYDKCSAILAAHGVSEAVLETGAAPLASSSAAQQHPREAPAAPRTLSSAHGEAGSTGSSSGTGAQHADGSDSGHDSEEHSEHGHPQESLFFLFNGVIFGTVILHLTTLPRLRGLQQTVVLYVLGIGYSLIQEGLGLSNKTGLVGRSYSMWMGIDPHLLLFAMLPVLLTGDAMTIDTSIARCVSKQCLFLAGPGVVMGSFLTALFLKFYLPYDWPFLLCLVTGSILAATDPVAVVGLLKELGASPTLTVQIQGESLLNDGTAIVLYTVAYNMLKGEQYDGGLIIIFLVQTAVCAMGLGVIIGWVFVFWIRKAANRLDHNSGTIQTALTLCCAYWSFIISEGVLKISGVLCTVASSLVLADKMWPAIVDKESLHHVWHMFEYLGNTLIFFLAGALTGKTMVQMEVQDYLHLIMIYVMTTIIRGCIFFASRPILTKLSEDKEPVSAADAAIMTWGGLRGAVGLVLAMQVSMDRADGMIDDIDGSRVLFYVGGIATMTLCINATTCPALVKFLGITSTPAAKQRLLMQIYEQLNRLTKITGHPARVQKTLDTVLHDARHHIEDLVRIQEKTFCGHALSSLSKKFSVIPEPRCGQTLVDNMEAARLEFQRSVPSHTLEFLDLPALPWAAKERELKDWVLGIEPEPNMIQCINEAFLALIRAQYWHQIEAGEFVAGTSDAEMLLSSVSFAFKCANRKLSDYTFLKHYLKLVHEEEVVLPVDISHEVDHEDDEGDGRKSSKSMLGSLHRAMSGHLRSRPHSESSGGSDHPVVCTAAPKDRESLVDLWTGNNAPLSYYQSLIEESVVFNMCMAFIICMNALFIILEQNERDTSNTNHIAWFIIELVFNVIFTTELVIKVIIFRLGYFKRCWNIFDLVLVVLGLFGLVIEIIVKGSDVKGNDLSGEARLLRMNRVFRVLRIIRIFRLAKFIRILRARLAHKDLSLELAEHLQTITVLRAFVRAHAKSQVALLNFIGTDGGLRSVEEARCIVESQTQIYKAITLAANEAKTVSPEILSGMALLRSNINATAELTNFVLTANKAGVINSREAECVLHPLEDHMRLFYKRLQASQEGLDRGHAEDTKHEKGQVVVPAESDFSLPGCAGQGEALSVNVS